MTRKELKAKYPQLRTLEPGTRYIASRPIDDGKRTEFPVYIRKSVDSPIPVVTFEGMSLASANDLLTSFNNGRSSLTGRVW